MATQSNRNHKRVQAYWELEKAVKELRKLGDPLIQTGDALKALGLALRHLQVAGEVTTPTVHQWEDEKGRHVKVSRDGLPQTIRTRATNLATQVAALATEVKALPVTPDQKVLAKVARAKARATKKGGRVGAKH
jgi:hypothetical protein